MTEKHQSVTRNGRTVFLVYCRATRKFPAWDVESHGDPWLWFSHERLPDGEIVDYACGVRTRREAIDASDLEG